MDRIGDNDGGMVGRGFEARYAGGGCDGDGGGDGGGYERGGASMVVVLVSEKVESAVKLMQDIED
jgi:hypothetical protein